MNTRQRLMLRWAAGIMLVLGIGHLCLGLFLVRDSVAGWWDRGVWAAVPLIVPEPTVDTLRNSDAFWGSVGSFAVPLALLGGLIWYLAGRGVTVPAFVGWGIAMWCLVGTVLLVPSPYFAGIIAGVLAILAARKGSEPGGSDRGGSTGT